VQIELANRRFVYAPPLLKVAAPSIAVVLMGCGVMFFVFHWAFVWQYLVWYLLALGGHLVQMQLLAAKNRRSLEQLEASRLDSRMERQVELMRMRLQLVAERIATDAPVALGAALTHARVELRALLFALEWHGTAGDLAAQLGIDAGVAERACAADNADVTQVHALALQAYARDA
jgi:hypothetical protein